MKREIDCEEYNKGVCKLTGEKCVGENDLDCPIVIDCYDPYFAGDCEEF